MENSQQIHDSQNSEPQTNQTEQPASPIQPASDQQHAKSKKKSLIILAVVVLCVLLVGSATAYVALVYLPNKPENVLKKAVSNYVSNPGAYTVSGKLDQAGPNDPDFNYTIKTSAAGDSEVAIQTSTFLQNPELVVRKVSGNYYVNFSQFEDLKKLATHYSNFGPKGIQEKIAEFTETSNLFSNQDQWLEVGGYIFEQPVSKSTTASESSNFDGMTLTSIGAEETLNGKTTRKYTVTLTKDAFTQLASRIDGSANVPVLSTLFPNTGVSADTVTADVWVNTDTKIIEQIQYEGRPFSDATFSLKTVANDSNTIVAPQAEKLTSKLGYGIVLTQLFNKQYQQAKSDTDKERIADLKGIKTALEIYKAKTGHYPERNEMSVDQESFIRSQMPGADLDIFKDPAGRLIGLSGSQYAYVSALNDDNQDCGRFNKPCEKYFIVTTLDDNQQYQLNSN